MSPSLSAGPRNETWDTLTARWALPDVRERGARATAAAGGRRS